MGNQSSSRKFGNFQRGVGVATADIGVVQSYVFLAFSIIVAIVLTIVAFVPFADDGGLHPMQKICNMPNTEPCPPGQHCDDTKKLCVPDSTAPPKPAPKKRHLILLAVAAFFLAFGIGGIFISRAMSNAAHKSRSFAQAYGTATEASLASNFIGNLFHPH